MSANLPRRALLLAPFALLTATPAAAETGFWEALTNGTPKAKFRYAAQYRDSELHVLQDSSGDVADTSVQQFSALGGYLGYRTGSWHGFGAGANLYAAMPFGNNPDDRRGLGGLNEDGGTQQGYEVLGEAYLQYENDQHLLRVGRQEMPGYRMVSLSDIRMTPITHQGGVYENRSVDNLQINLGYIARMKERNAEEFIDMALGARLREFDRDKQLIRGDYDPDNFDENGYTGPKKAMYMAGLIYSPEAFTLEAWNYHVEDFVNSIYLYGDYKFWSTNRDVQYKLAAQYTRQHDVGDHIGGNIDTWHWGALFSMSAAGWNGFIGFNEVSYNERSYDGGTLFVRWGTPQMFNSFQVQDSELAGTRSAGIGFQYDFGHSDLLRGVVMRWRFGHYDMPDRLTQADARQDRQELTFDLRYSFTRDSGFGIFTTMEGLSVQFRVAFNDYETDYDFEAFKEIHGYDFETATDNFVDWRIYVEYLW